MSLDTKEKEYMIRFLYDNGYGWYKDVCSLFAKNKVDARHKFYENYKKKEYIIIQIEKL